MPDSKLEQILKGERPETTKPASPIKSALEQELSDIDNEIANELRRTRAEEIIANRRRRIEQITGGSASSSDDRAARREQSTELSLVEVAQGLLEKGLDPQTVGRMVDYLLGSRSPSLGAAMNPFGPPAQGAQGISINDMLNFADRLTAKKDIDPLIANILDKLTDQVKELKERVENPPQLTGSVMVQQPDGTFVEVAKSEKTFVIPRPPAPSTGKTVEELKEENRHAEEKERIDIERKSKESLANSVAEIPPVLAEILASAAEKKGNSPEAPRARTEPVSPTQITCEECKTIIPIPPGARQVTCPKCKVVYNFE